MKLPVHVAVPAPAGAFPTMHFNLYRREDAEKRLTVVLRTAAELESADNLTAGQLLAAIHFRHAVDPLLDGLLEVIRCGEDREVEQSWWGPEPAWPLGRTSEAAA